MFNNYIQGQLSIYGSTVYNTSHTTMINFKKACTDTQTAVAKDYTCAVICCLATQVFFVVFSLFEK